ncbi:Short chain dehydrogenase gsfK [Lachnellula suecica]|uniref:Short chain dehydrogenase gsfK n=1 Tax=Lachnellula suecica TaxID=602035 RepID=A0A8T9BZS8_9HELO|nr:Short chain dehydrogenase gsfK [Lachnellula suecica]
MAPTIVLITGANRGIGKGLLSLYLAKPNHTVIAANRDPSHPTSKALFDLPKAEGTSLILVKIDATVPTDAADAVNSLASQGINHVDILIANAGIAYLWPTVADVKVADMQKHFETNVYGVVYLYQAFLPVLKKSNNPRWVSIGSGSGFLTLLANSCSVKNMIPVQNAAYGPSKVVLHWLTKAIQIEEPVITAFPIDPGWVQTDMGNLGAELRGLEKAILTVEESVAGLMKVIDAATKETHSGRLWKYDGEQVQW